LTEPAPGAPDPEELLRSRNFVALLLFAAVVGVLVSLASWAFLELMHQMQVGLFTDLPGRLGFDDVPEWWPLPVLAVGGLAAAWAIVRLPGNGGHVPAGGLKAGSAAPNTLPGVALAALATLGFGLVLGPEAPLIALGGGLAVVAVTLAKKDAPQQMLTVLAAAGALAAISVIFGSPVVAAILMIEVLTFSGVGGAMLQLVMIPGLIAAGIGSLIFIGMADFSGLDTSAYSLVPVHLSTFTNPTFAEIGWTVVIGLGAAVLTVPVRKLGFATAGVAPRKSFLYLPAIGLVVAGLAIGFDQATGKGVEQVLFSGQDALTGLVGQAGTWSVGALALLFLCKGIAWGLCLGSFRGGPTFPAIFLGAAGGIAASHLPGMPLTPAVAVGMGAMTVAFLKLPLSSIVIATALTLSGGVSTLPLIIVGVVVAFLATLALEELLGTANGSPGTDPSAAAAT
jgi:H+/Cl- antiporter ClcA